MSEVIVFNIVIELLDLTLSDIAAVDIAEISLNKVAHSWVL